VESFAIDKDTGEEAGAVTDGNAAGDFETGVQIQSAGNMFNNEDYSCKQSVNFDKSWGLHVPFSSDEYGEMRDNA
jgi:hypothetical protein